MEDRMAREGPFILDSGDKLPMLSMETVNHGRLVSQDVLALIQFLKKPRG
jgi:hypothetical protein